MIHKLALFWRLEVDMKFETALFSKFDCVLDQVK